MKKPIEWPEYKKQALERFTSGWKGDKNVAADAIECGAEAMMECLRNDDSMA